MGPVGCQIACKQVVSIQASLYTWLEAGWRWMVEYHGLESAPFICRCFPVAWKFTLHSPLVARSAILCWLMVLED